VRARGYCLGRAVRLVGALAAIAGPLAGCKNDPLSDLDGTPVATFVIIQGGGLRDSVQVLIP
jgi:hypothetical protein